MLLGLFCHMVIYSDGYVMSGTDQGAYAIVVTSGDVSNRTRLRCGGGGRALPSTSSFEMEAFALGLAVDYVGNTKVGRGSEFLLHYHQTEHA